MASANLTKCEDCGKMVSINAITCPSCGSPIQQQGNTQKSIANIASKKAKEEKAKRDSLQAGSALIGLIILFFAYSIFDASILASILLLLSGLLAFGFTKDFLKNKKPAIDRKIWIALSVILGVIGLTIGHNAREKQNAEYLLAHPEVEQQRQKEQAEKQAQEAQEKANKEKEKANQEKADATSKVMLVTKCQLAIQPNLKNPKSMDVDVSGSEYGNYKGKPAVILHYYAQNGFGATILNKASCTFDDNGNLLAVKDMK